MTKKKLLTWCFKVALTALAIWLLSKKISWLEVKEIILKANFLWLFFAFLLYIISKLLSAFRLNILQKQISIQLPDVENVKLYFIGMFYNLFLPGGIGGDGYKAVYLKDRFQQKTKTIVSALFLDRFYGLAALFILLFTTLFCTSIFEALPSVVFYISIALFVLVLPVTYGVIYVFFKHFLAPFWRVIFYSLCVQLVQVLSALSIIKSIGLEGNVLNYIALFLASSIASVLPISVGGVGVRELTFVYGNELLAIQKDDAVAFSLLFFVITALSSLMGAFITMKAKSE